MLPLLYPYIRQPLSSSELGQWIAKHMPELDRELGPLTKDQCRIRLNEITGLDVKPTDTIKQTLPLYFARLREMHKSNTP